MTACSVRLYTRTSGCRKVMHRMARNFRVLKFSLFSRINCERRKFHTKNKFARATTTPACGATSQSQHFRPFICSCCIKKFWLFFSTSTLRTSLTISYSILVVLSLELVRDRLFNSSYSRPYYGDRKRILVILSFPDTGQLLAYSSNPHPLINMAATHHRLKRGGLVLFNYRRTSINGCALCRIGPHAYMHMWVECANTDPRRGDPRKLN